MRAGFRGIAFAVVACALATPAVAQAPGLEQQWVQCTNAGWTFADDLSIGACTAIISSGLETQENIAIAFFNRGNGQSRKRGFAAAIADYTQAINLGAADADVYYGRSIAYYENGDYSHAMTDVNEALRQNPAMAEALAHRGDIHQYGAHDYDNAIADYDRALAIREDATDLIRRANAYQYGRQDLDRALAIEPNADAHVDRGNVYYAREDYAGAIVEYEAALAANPNFATARYNRGNARSSLGDVDGAMADWTEVIRLDPNYADALGNRGDAYYDRGQFDLALADLDRALAVRVNATDLSTRGMIYEYGFRDFLRAIADFDQASIIEPANPDHHNSACWARAVADRELEVARSHCDMAIAALPTDANVLDSRGLVGLRQSRFQDAWNDYDAAARLDATLASAFFGRGIAALRLGRASVGQADIAAAIALDPNIAQTYADMGITP